MRRTPENENLGMPKSVLDIYEEAKNAPTVDAAVKALEKAASLSKMEQAIFIVNLGSGFNQAAKKNGIISATPLDRKDLKQGFHVIYNQEP